MGVWGEGREEQCDEGGVRGERVRGGEEATKTI